MYSVIPHEGYISMPPTPGSGSGRVNRPALLHRGSPPPRSLCVRFQIAKMYVDEILDLTSCVRGERGLLFNPLNQVPWYYLRKTQNLPERPPPNGEENDNERRKMIMKKVYIIAGNASKLGITETPPNPSSCHHAIIVP